MARFVEKQVKSILNIHKYIDSWFWDKYSVSAYQGCQFNCIYCYARSRKYSNSFGDKDTIYIKKDPASMLDLRIERARTLLPDIVAMSGVCDPYQPAEKKYRKTRGCLEILAKHRWPVHILTKSALVERDIDILSDIAKDTWASVTFTITASDSNMAKFLEPNAFLPEERFEALSRIKRKNPHIQAGIAAMPIVPYIEDNMENITALAKSAKEAGADYFIFSPGLTMDDDQAVKFLNLLVKRFPGHIPGYEELYGFKYSPEAYTGTYGPKKSYSIKLSKQIFEVLEEYGLPYRIKRFIPSGYRRLNYILAGKLLDRAFRSQYDGKAWSNMHWAGQNIGNLKESIADIAGRGELRKITNVDDMIESFIMENINHLRAEGNIG